MTVIHPRLKKLRLCIIDGDPRNVSYLVNMLRETGFTELSSFPTFTDFLVSIRNTPPHIRQPVDLLILSDSTGDANIFETTQSVSMNSDYGGTGVVVYSSVDEEDLPDVIQQCYEAGAIDVLHHSYDHLQLLSRLSMALRLQQEVKLRQIREESLETELAERKVMEARLKHLVAHDDLTGLANRRRLEQALELAVIRARNFHRVNALMYIDLDQFKVVNDAEGHDVGDRLLVQVAKQLRASASKGSLVARISSDEFAILIEHTTEAEAVSFADTLRQDLSEMEFRNGEVIYHIAASIGLVVNTPDEQVTATQLLARADQACFIAKMQGRNTVYRFSDTDAGLRALRSDARWVPAIRKALADDRFFMVYQPIMDMRTGKVSHYEALLRMRSEEGEVYTPGDFIEVAERMGLIHQIDLWVVEHVLDYLENLPPEHSDVSIGLNLSAYAFQDRMLLPLVQRKLEMSWINASRLVFEVTETAAIMNFNETRDMVSRLRALGCRFALDDFGSGFSSFSYVKHYPADLLKIDGSFIINIVDDNTDLLLVRSMVEVAHALGKKVIAECVENAETMNVLRDLGVDYIQGNYLGEPRVELAYNPVHQKVEKPAKAPLFDTALYMAKRE